MRLSITFILLLSLFTARAQSSSDYYKKADELYEKKDYQNAIAQIDLALKTDSTNSDYLLLKANSLAYLNYHKEAFYVYSKMIDINPKNAIAFNQRGLLLNSIQQSEYAIKDFDQALLVCPDSLKLSLYVNRGVAKLSIRNFREAYDDFIAAYKIDSTEIGVLNNLASVCDEVGKGDQTLSYLHRILAIDSTFIGAYGNIGFKYQEMGDHKTAIQYFNKVLSLEPDDPITLNNRGYNKFKLGDYSGALKDINKSISLYPANSFAFKNRALIYIAQKQRQKACADIEQALNLGFTKMYGNEMEELKEKHCMDKL